MCTYCRNTKTDLAIIVPREKQHSVKAALHQTIQTDSKIFGFHHKLVALNMNKIKHP